MQVIRTMESEKRPSEIEIPRKEGAQPQPQPQPILQKQLSQKANCLCSPTTHSGSFRCRRHRNPFRRSGNSVGSGLSDLADKTTSSSNDNLTKA